MNPFSGIGTPETRCFRVPGVNTGGKFKRKKNAHKKRKKRTENPGNPENLDASARVRHEDGGVHHRVATKGRKTRQAGFGLGFGLSSVQIYSTPNKTSLG